MNFCLLLKIWAKNIGKKIITDNTNNDVKFQTSIISSSLCDYSYGTIEQEQAQIMSKKSYI